jgi:hypothetical protein
MTGHIAQRLLCHSKKAKPRVERNAVREHFHAGVDGNRLLLLESFTLHLERVRQAQILQQRGMQLVGKRMHIFAQSDQSVAHLPNQFAASIAFRSQGGAAGIDGQAREALRDIIVQLPGQPGPFRLLRVNELATQLPGHPLGLLALGDIAHKKGQGTPGWPA